MQTIIHVTALVLFLLLCFTIMVHIIMLIILYMMRPEHINVAFLSSRHKADQIKRAKQIMKEDRKLHVEKFIYDVVDYELKFEEGTGFDRYFSRVYMIMFKYFNW